MEATVPLPAMLLGPMSARSLAPQCLCCGDRMQWCDWSRRAWLGESSHMWASLCERCDERNRQFSSLFDRRGDP